MARLIGAMLLLLSGMAQAQFEARDINGDGTVDAYYDVMQNISWLGDANYYATQGGPLDLNPFGSASDPIYLLPGQLRLDHAVSWVDTLNVAGLGGWRLPQRFVPAGGPDGSVCSATECYEGFPWRSELSVLATSLGGAPGSFVNVQNAQYFAYDLGSLWVDLTNPLAGTRGLTDETSLVWGYAWAVHDGDVGTLGGAVTPVPEPSTYLLMAAALAVLALRVGRERRAHSRPVAICA